MSYDVAAKSRNEGQKASGNIVSEASPSMSSSFRGLEPPPSFAVQSFTHSCTSRWGREGRKFKFSLFRFRSETVSDMEQRLC